MHKLKKIPDFKNEAEERAFWESHDSSAYLDWEKAQPVSLPNLKPSAKQQERIRGYRGKLRWSGDLEKMRTD